MTDAEIIAELFGCPCNYTPIDEEMCVNCDCEHICGTPEQTDAKCWQRYFDLKRKEDGNVILAEEDFDAEKEKSMELGYNLCKEQMLKGAVEGTVVDAGFDDSTALVSIPDKRYDEGDKVRVIVLPKEDEQ